METCNCKNCGQEPIKEHCDERNCVECQTTLLDKYKKDLVEEIEKRFKEHMVITTKENLLSIINNI